MTQHRSRREVMGQGAALATALSSPVAIAGTLTESKGRSMVEDVTPFTLAIPQAQLDDLAARLRHTRWPDQEAVPDGSQGVPLAKMKALVDYWRTGYDWRRCEAMLNGFGQHRTVIDGLGIHFLHIRSPHKDALPLILTHGWPGSVLEFHKVIGPLTNPTAHGGRAEDAFHLVIPSLPGFGFSDKPTEPGWGLPHVARAWAELMRRLGYDRYVAQGGDWGAGVTTLLGAMGLRELAGIHLNLPILFPPPLVEGAQTDGEKAALADLMHYQAKLSGYAQLQGTRPQTIGYALTESPSGQAAWIYEKLTEWADCGGNAESIFTRDEILDTIMLYWLPAAGASSARLYWESFARDFRRIELSIPTGVSIFKGDSFRPPRIWGERTYRNLIYWNEVDHGGHFAAFEQPEAFVKEVRACFARLRHPA